MLEPMSGKLSEFVTVHHDGTGQNFRMHKQDLPKIGTTQKVIVYHEKNSAYYGPSEEFPNGLYTAKTKVFVGSYLKTV